MTQERRVSHSGHDLNLDQVRVPPASDRWRPLARDPGTAATTTERPY